jgi:glutamate/tyrosine decarboxylase-like PLP-dependent enzyme
MINHLQQDKEHISNILAQVKEVAQSYFSETENLAPGKFVADLALKELPEHGIGAQETITYFQQHYAPLISNSAGPRYFGFVTGGSTPAAVAGDWLVSTYDQNAFGSNDSIAPQLEKQTIQFLKNLFGLDESFFGTFVTGATVSNFTNLAIARQWVGEQQGVDASMDGANGLTIPILSATPHSSIIKSLSMLGVGRKHIIKVDTLPNREAIDIESLKQQLIKLDNQPCIIVASAGTVNTGDFDDLVALGELKKTYNFWLHVDAAFGGFAVLSAKHNHFMNGINYADSITIDAHKWLNVPYDAAMQFTKRKDLQLKIFQNSAAYLGDPTASPDYFHYTPENSRRWRALPAWFSLMAYGKKGYTEIIERNCRLAEMLGDWINLSEKFELLAPVKLNIVCFTITNANADKIKTVLNQIRDDGRVFFTPTVYKGVPAIRAAISNWQTTDRDIEITIEVLNKFS